MPDAKTPRRARWMAALLIAAALLVVGGVLVMGERLADDVRPVAWNKEPCAHCRMHIGDRAFAAQLQYASGKVESFDDPGCAFKAIASAKAADLHAVYFRHMSEDRWIARAAVRFVAAEGTPMGYGFGAVDGEVPGSLTLAQALQKVLGAARAEVGHAR